MSQFHSTGGRKGVPRALSGLPVGHPISRKGESMVTQSPGQSDPYDQTRISSTNPPPVNPLPSAPRPETAKSAGTDHSAAGAEPPQPSGPAPGQYGGGQPGHRAADSTVARSTAADSRNTLRHKDSSPITGSNRSISSRGNSHIRRARIPTARRGRTPAARRGTGLEPALREFPIRRSTGGHGNRTGVVGRQDHRSGDRRVCRADGDRRVSALDLRSRLG